MSRKSKFVGLSPWKASVKKKKRKDNCIAIQVPKHKTLSRKSQSSCA